MFVIPIYFFTKDFMAHSRGKLFFDIFFMLLFFERSVEIVWCGSFAFFGVKPRGNNYRGNFHSTGLTVAVVGGHGHGA